MRRVSVDVPGRAYDVVIGEGALKAARAELAELTAKPSAVVADETVLQIHGASLAEALPGLKIITVPAGESTKSWAQFERVSEELLAAGVERQGAVVAFGGGVTGDLAGFCAATLRRGCKLIQIPTTLLSQVDSSVGGKTAINSRAGKNLIGAFHQPELVVIDTRFLSTLPKREFLAGYAEVIKTAALGDAGFFSWLDAHTGDIINLSPEPLSEAIATCCAAKARIVAADEKEQGQRALLNLGHTFGHAIEALGGYDGRVLHGEAVGLGMAMAARFSVETGAAEPGTETRLEALLHAAGLQTRLTSMPFETPAEALLDAMYQDKKVDGGALTLILLEEIGTAFIKRGQDPAELLDFLGREAQLPPL